MYKKTFVCCANFECAITPNLLFDCKLFLLLYFRLQKVVNNSSRNGHHVTQLVKDTGTPVIFYYLKNIFDNVLRQ